MGFRVNALLMLLLRNNAASNCWNEHGDLLKINGDNVTRIGDYSLGFNTVYGSENAHSGSHDWLIKLHKMTHGTIRIGVSSNTNYKNADFVDHDNQTYSYAYIGFNGDKYGQHYFDYASSFDSGDIIGVHLDLNHKTLSFSKNGQDLGVAFNETDLILSNYRLAVSILYAFDRIECLSHDIQNVPTSYPTLSPTISPSMSPTMTPTMSPTISPTISPSMSPTMSPTMTPTMSPTLSPTMSPTNDTSEISTIGSTENNEKIEQRTINLILFIVFAVCAAVCCLGIFAAFNKTDEQYEAAQQEDEDEDEDVELSEDSKSIEVKDDTRLSQMDSEIDSEIDSMMRVYTLEEEFQMQPNLGV